jgi:hypothetical protein
VTLTIMGCPGFPCGIYSNENNLGEEESILTENRAAMGAGHLPCLEIWRFRTVKYNRMPNTAIKVVKVIPSPM